MRTLFSWSVVAVLVALGTGCTGETKKTAALTKELFGQVGGHEVYLYTLRNTHGMEARITNYGGILVALNVPDRTGASRDVVLGYDSLASYVKDSPYFGSLVGRYANRIARGKFTLDGREYTLAANDGPNHLHGGVRGFDKVVWDVREPESTPGRNLVLRYVSKDGEEGYPGTLSAKVTYTLTDSNELRIDYEATTDAPTICNLTHHSYFNLAGAGERDILEHQLMIAADGFTPIDATLIPTGEIRPVRLTPFDFTAPEPIGSRIAQRDSQLVCGLGYDHNWVLSKPAGEFGLAARVTEPSSGMSMEVWTTEPGLQFYSGNFLDGHHLGKGGRPYNHRYGFCLEPQHFPDSPNRPSFPGTVLRPGQVYTTTTVFRFTTDNAR